MKKTITKFVLFAACSTAIQAKGQWMEDATTIWTKKTNLNVGIGLSNPAAKLDIYNSTNLNTAAGSVTDITGFAGLTNSKSALKVQLYRHSDGLDWLSASTRLQAATDGAHQAYLEFNPKGAPAGLALGTASGNAITVNANSNVGIGTTSPQTSLDVNGAIRVGASQPIYFLGGPDDKGYLIQSGAWNDGMKYKHFTSHQFFTQGDKERLRITQDGNVGIGTSNPVVKLHVYNQGANTQLLVGNVMPGYTSMTMGTSADMGGYTYINSVKSSGTDWGSLVLNQEGGNVGIGTSDPQDNLTVSVAGSPYPRKAMSIDVKSFGTADNAKNSYYFRCRDVDGLTTAFYIRGDGNVGIGTSNPAVKLHVYNQGANTQLLVGNVMPGYTSMTMGTSADMGGYTYISSIKSSGTDWGSLVLNQEGGNVGIGTTSPQTSLDVNGAIRVGANQPIYFLGGPDDKFYLIQSGAWNDGMKYKHFTSHQFFTQGDKERLRITQDGNVGIGTTKPEENLTLAIPSSSSPIKAMSIDVNTFGTADNSKNSYYFRCRDAGAGTTAFYIRGDGNVGIGTSSPTQKLSVNGTIQAKEIVVNTGWSDFVFDNNYKLRPLTEVEQFVKTNKHLPEIPSQKEVEKNGVQLGDISSKLLMKIEELTLYIIQQQKEIEKQKAINNILVSKIEKLETKQ